MFTTTKIEETDSSEVLDKMKELNKNIVELNKNLDALITTIDDLALAIKQRF